MALWNVLLTCLVLTALAPQAQAIVRGHEIPDSELQTYQPLLKLGFNRAPCTGTHIGKGLILTAYHCVVLPKRPGQDRPDLCVFDHEGDSVGCIFGGDYTVSIPSTPEHRTVVDSANHRIEVPFPDVAILIISDSSLRRKVSALGSVALPELSDVLSRQSVGVRIAGAGCNTYDPGFFSGDGSGRLRVGTPSPPLMGLSHYILPWFPSGTTASACPGDSGGPLYTIDAHGRLVQHGVASHIVINRNDDRETVSVMSHYGRTDIEVIRRWIYDALSHNL